MEARGEFEVTMTPEPTDCVPTDSARTDGTRTDSAPADAPPADPIGRFRLDKRYHGPLSGRSEGQMLTHRTAVEGSAGYTALERVTGTLDGRSGTFVLLHYGAMAKGTPTRWGVSIVPDSGTDELLGLSGELEIVMEGSKHRYILRYEIENDE